MAVANASRVFVVTLSLCGALVSAALAQKTFSARLTMMPIDEVNRGLVTGEG